MPIPLVKGNPRSRNTNGKFRKIRSDRGKKRGEKELKVMKKVMYPQREPDIAFWFDQENDAMYVVRITDKIKHFQLVMAHFELFAKALETNEQTTIGQSK